MKRILHPLAFVVVSSLVLVGLGSPPASSQPTGPTAGEWVGFYHYDSGAVFDTDDGDVLVGYAVSGSFDFVTANGALSGNYVLDVRAELPDLGATAVADASGDLDGPATEPDMTLLFTTVSSEVQGITVELSFTAAELGNPRGKMIPMGGSCSSVYGTWSQEFSLGMEAQGGSVDQLTGNWRAFRNTSLGDNDPATMEAEMASLNARGQTILDQVRAGTINTSEVRDYLAVAEGAILSGTTRSNCDEGIDSGSEATFRSLAAANVDEILQQAALDIDNVDDWTFLSLMLSGYRTGIFDEATELREFYETDFDRRADAALTGGDPDTLRIFLAYAAQLGKGELAADILGLLGEVEG